MALWSSRIVSYGLSAPDHVSTDRALTLGPARFERQNYRLVKVQEKLTFHTFSNTILRFLALGADTT